MVEPYFSDTKVVLRNASQTCYDILKNIKGLKPVKGKGAMYMMVGIDIEMFKDIEDDLDFCKKMVDEVQVFCLPSKCFSSKNMF